MGRKATILLANILFGMFSFIMAVVAAVGWMAGVVHPDKSWLIAMLALGMTPILLVNFVILLIWLIKRSWGFVMPLAAIALNFGYISAMVQVDFRSEEKIPACEFKIASYNIHGYSHKDFSWVLGDVLGKFNRQSVDVVCFQEFFELPKESIDSLNKYYPHYVCLEGVRGMQLAVFSKYPIESASPITFNHTANSAMSANILVKDRVIHMINVHFQTTNLNQSKAEIARLKDYGIEDPMGKDAFDVIMARLALNASLRAAQVDQIRSQIDATKNASLIVCGDFNDIPSSFTYRRIKEGLMDGFVSCGKGYAYTFNPMYKLFRLDYILYSDQFVGVRYQGSDIDYSDHNPVMMELSFQKR